MTRNYKAHLEQLALANDIRLIDWDEAIAEGFVNPWNASFVSFSGLGDYGEKVTYLDEKDTPEAQYYTGLHELGHHVMGHTSIEKNELSYAEIVEKEIEAWEWAFANAKGEPTDEAYLVMMEGLSSYTDELAAQANETQFATFLRHLRESGALTN